MLTEVDLARLVAESAAPAGLGVLVVQLVPLRIVHANDMATELLERSFEELQRCDPRDYIAPEQRDVALARLSRRIAGETLPPAEVTVALPSGHRAVLACRFVNREVEGCPGVVVFFHAPSAPHADLAADASYRRLVDAAPDGVAITRHGRFLYANRAALDLLGLSAEELATRSLDQLVTPEDVEVMTTRTSAMLRDAGQRFPPRDYRVPGKDTLVEVSSVAIDFEGGPAVLAFVRDVTERRRVQAELARTHRLAALGTLVAGVAHEVNNPLAFATMGAQLLRRFFDREDEDRETGRAALANVQLGLERITSLVRELRAFVRADRTELVPVDLAEVVAAARRMTAPLLRTRVTIDAAVGGLPLVCGSPSRLEQVFVNLFINAAQSFDADNAAQNLISVRASFRDGEVVVTVSDNGGGIPRENLGRVFDPFFTTKVGDGTGLGLSIVHAIVTQHDGRIAIDSHVGQGTSVTISVPVADATAAPPPDVAAATASLRARVLVVDDEPAIGHMFRDMLTPGYDVSVATGGRRALELLLAPGARYDVVLCDIRMPEISGLAVFERVREERPELAKGFVFMTGGFFGDEVNARAPDVPQLEKPSTEAELAAMIERVRAGDA